MAKKGTSKKKQKPVKRRQRVKKVTHDQFFAILRENAGLFSRTARAIQKKFKVTYTRQAVQERAHKHPDILADIDEENLDIAEDGLKSMIEEKNRSKFIRLDAIKFFLKYKGRKRGYIEKSEVDTNLNVKKSQQIFISQDGKRISLKIKDKKNELPAE